MNVMSRSLFDFTMLINFLPANHCESSFWPMRNLVGEASPARDLVVESSAQNLGQVAVARIADVEGVAGALSVDVEVAVIAGVWTDGGDVILQLRTARQAKAARGDDVVAGWAKVAVGAQVDAGIRADRDGIGVEAGLTRNCGLGFVGGNFGDGGAVWVAISGRSWHSSSEAKEAGNGESGSELHGECRKYQ